MNRRDLMASVGALAVLPAGVAGKCPTEAPGPACSRWKELQLLLGAVQKGDGNQRWAKISSGLVLGGDLPGRVHSGTVTWCVDPMSGAFSVAVECRVIGFGGVARTLQSSAVEVGAADFSRGRVLLRAANLG